jgi:hypothetical protein
MGHADSFQSGLLLAPVVALIALPIAIVIALALIRLFRSRVARSMRAASGAPQEPEPSAGEGSKGALDIDLIETARTDEGLVPSLADARRQSREIAAIHAEAACIYPLVFVLLWWTPPERILPMAALVGFFMVALGTPVVLAGVMILCRQPRFLALSAGALVAVLLAFDGATAADGRLVLYVGAATPVIAVLTLMMLRREPRFVMLISVAIVVMLVPVILLSGQSIRSGTDFVGFWLMTAAVPTGAVVLLNTRRLRAVGPIVFVLMLFLLFGIVAGVFYASLLTMHAVNPQFVRADLAQMPFGEALLKMPLPDILATVHAMAHDRASVYRYDIENWTLWVKLQSLGIFVLATALGALAAWTSVRWLASSYKRRRASDQMLTVDVMMLIFVVPLSVLVTTWPENQLHGWLLGAVGLASFAGYKFWTRLRLRSWRQRKRPTAPRTLLLLRVFGFERRTQRLLEDVGQRWRYLGPIRLIGGTDLAYATLEPHEFLDFLSGRLSRAFVKDREDLQGRLAEGRATPDPDGCYRVEEFFCHDDTWRMTVSRLAMDADAVLMDLRGFSPANRGCIFEIEQLIAGVALDRVVLLADASTDTPFLIETVREAWRTLPDDALNADGSRHRVRIVKAGSRHRPTLQCLLGLLCQNFPENTVAAAPSPNVGHGGAIA